MMKQGMPMSFNRRRHSSSSTNRTHLQPLQELTQRQPRHAQQPELLAANRGVLCLLTMHIFLCMINASGQVC
jgi:hypothetical protein